ncbi:MAG: hypothetical protein NVSMB45_15050 [Ginsengibacter sp.]
MVYMIGTTQTLISDVINYQRKLLAKSGDKVKVISISDPAVIVELKGERFSTNVKNLKA